MSGQNLLSFCQMAVRNMKEIIALHSKIIMLKLLKPILLKFFTTTAVKRLVVDLLRAICKQTTNTLDDKAVDLLEHQLFPKMN